MKRRTWIGLTVLGSALKAGEHRVGRLDNVNSPRIRHGDKEAIELAGDDEVMSVLRDRRLDGAEIEVRGRIEAGRLRVDPSHTSPLRVLQSGRRLVVTYWCDTCAIRTYAPGICVCCREDTELDLRESI